MKPADLTAVMAIAAEVHPDYPEDRAVFAERLTLAPEGCRVLADARDDALGYLVSHPWPPGAVPALNALLGEVPVEVDNWYIHDLALLPVARGGGAASAAVREIAALAAEKGCATLSLVAVAGSSGFWQRQGFRPVDDPALARKLASYDDAARYMQRPLDSRRPEAPAADRRPR